jgi:hypothetical protein
MSKNREGKSKTNKKAPAKSLKEKRVAKEAKRKEKMGVSSIGFS